MVNKTDSLRDLAIEASKNAYSIYSNAFVGSALITSKGNIYTGCNIENSSYGATVCAERVAIWKAISNGEKEIKRIYIYSDAGWPPCGMCRQVLAEFAHKDLEVIIGNKSGEEKIYSFNEIFPLAFTPQHMNK